MSAHTPRCNDCHVVTGLGTIDGATLCPLHAAAPRMLELIQSVSMGTMGPSDMITEARAILRDVEAQAMKQAANPAVRVKVREGGQVMKSVKHCLTCNKPLTECHGILWGTHRPLVKSND